MCLDAEQSRMSQQLEREIKAAALSAATTSEKHTRLAVDGLRDEVRVHIEQNRVNFERRQEETRQTVSQVAAGLEKLTRQMALFNPVSEDAVGNLEKNLPKEVAQKLSDSEKKANALSESLANKKNQLMTMLSSSGI